MLSWFSPIYTAPLSAVVHTTWTRNGAHTFPVRFGCRCFFDPGSLVINMEIVINLLKENSYLLI